MRRRTRLLLGGVAAAGIALAAIAQDSPQSLLPPGFGAAPPKPRPAPATAPASDAPAGPAAPAPAIDQDPAIPAPETLPADLPPEPPLPPEEMPEAARRPLDLVGTEAGYGADAFGQADGRYLATLMRRIETPIASRWAEITLRRMLLSRTPAPPGESEADWVADRAALLLRLGEADGARMLIQSVDVEDFSPRLRGAAMRAALATADPAGLCPLPDGAERIGDQPAWPMIRAMCATLSGDAATANAMIGRGPPADPIDHALAEKLVAAGGSGRRAVTIDWTAVDQLSDWRFGLASALGVVIPQALLDAAPAWFTAWLARAPMLAAADRVAPARVAAALGPVSSYDLVDLYGRVMDESGEIATDSPAGRLRAAYLGDDDAQKLAALHMLWEVSGEGLPAERDRYAGWILTARAAARIAPSAGTADDASPLIAAMFSAGLDRQAERWAGIAGAAGGDAGRRAWAMLAVGATRPVVAVDAKALDRFADTMGDSGRHRTAMLAAALAGLGRITPADAARIAAAAGLPLGGRSRYGDALQRAVAGGERGTVALLVATGMQTPRWGGVPPGDFYRMIAALEAVGLDGEARMIAAESMARL